MMHLYLLLTASWVAVGGVEREGGVAWQSSSSGQRLTQHRHRLAKFGCPLRCRCGSWPRPAMTCSVTASCTMDCTMLVSSHECNKATMYCKNAFALSRDGWSMRYCHRILTVCQTFKSCAACISAIHMHLKPSAYVIACSAAVTRLSNMHYEHGYTVKCNHALYGHVPVGQHFSHSFNNAVHRLCVGECQWHSSTT